VEPDAFADGTDISSSYAGVTLSGPGQADPKVYSLYCSPYASTGDNVFGNSLYEWEWGGGFNDGMRVDFATPTDFVSIDIIANDGNDKGRLLAFNSSDVQIASYETEWLVAFEVETAVVSRVTADISYVIAKGSLDGVDAISLDNLQYNGARIPAPSTLIGLLSMGLMGLVVAWRRRKRAA